MTQTPGDGVNQVTVLSHAQLPCPDAGRSPAPSAPASVAAASAAASAAAPVAATAASAAAATAAATAAAPAAATAAATAARRRLLLLIVGAVIFKLVYLVQYARLPFLRAPIYDSVVYLRQARAVLDGDFGHPTLLAFSPLYGYLLAALGGGASVGAPILAQLALGTLNLYLVYRFVRPRFGEAAALCGALLYLGYGLLLCYESKLVSETAALTLALLATTIYAGPRFAAGRPAAAIGAGVLIALSVLQRASLIFAPILSVALALLPFARGEALRPRILRAAGLALGLALVLGGNGLWNRVHTGLFVPVILVSDTAQKTTRADFGDNFSAFAGDNPTGAPNAFDVVNQAERRLAAVRAGQPDPAARRGLGVDVRGLLRGAPVKLVHTFVDDEVSYDYGYFGERSEVSALALLPVSFGVLLILGIVGAAAVIRRSRWGIVPYLPYALASVATTTVFHASSRYRLFLVIPLVLLGGHGAGVLLRGLRGRLPGRLAAMAGLLICGALSARTLGYQLEAPALWQLRVAQAAAAAGDRAELARREERARALAPQNPTVEARIALLHRGLPAQPR